MSRAFEYLVYGLRLRSALPVPCLTEVPSTGQADVQVWFGQHPTWQTCGPDRLEENFYISPDLDGRGKPSITVWRLEDGNFRMLYDDGTEFFIDERGTQVWATWPPPLTLEDTAVFLRGPILGFVLRLRGRIPLHASAVAIDGHAIALVGPAGAGKSTTAAVFARLGFPVLSDDIVPILACGDSFLAQPGYPCLCLWPEAVHALWGSPDALPALTPNWEKRYLDLCERGYRFEPAPRPLAAIYVLGDRSGESRDPVVGSVPPSAGFLTLVANTYMNYLLDGTMRVREFAWLSGLVSRVPVRRVRPTADPDHLSRLCEVLVEDTHALRVCHAT